jgi:dihydropteroate synthase
MGILNVTPDSFSDGGTFLACDDAVAHALRLVEDGADIIDIGGESTRPFSDPVSPEDEIERVVPVIEKLAGSIKVPISIDTTKANVAKQAIEAGASIINDISGMRLDYNMTAVAAEYSVPVIIMHMQGSPQTMQISPVYDDLIGEIKDFFQHSIDSAVKRGVVRSRIIIDPGIGFGKTLKHNLLIIKNLSDFDTLDVPILIGPSRKSFLKNLLKDELKEDPEHDLSLIESGTQAAVAAAVLNGAHIVRVHDVAGTRSTLKIIDAINQNHYDS